MDGLVRQYADAHSALQTDEDMFAACKSLGSKAIATVAGKPVVMPPPVAITSMLSKEEVAELEDVALAIRPDGIYATAVGPPTKLTKADYHVTTPELLVDAMVYLTEQ